MSCLVKFGFGGVQDFIAQAKMTRDLATGSRLIQFLSAKKAASEIVSSVTRKAAGGVSSSLRLPAPSPSGGLPAAFPHQFVFRVDDDLRQARTLAERMRRAVQTELKSLSVTHGTFQPFTNVDRAIITQHLGAALDVYWVAIEETGDYTTDFQRLSRLYDDRRHTRTFEQLAPLPTPPGNQTCVQCGLRPAIGQGSASGTGAGLFSSEKDQLCAVCAAKRIWSASAMIAAVPTTYELARQRICRNPRFREHPRLRECLPLSLEEIPESAADLRVPLARLSPYWALIVFDGDRMGRWFRGEFLPRDESLEGLQKKLSGGMSHFSGQVSTLCQAWAEQSVVLLYTGGDDGLVMAPLDFALPLAGRIHEAWRSTVQEVLGATTADGHATTVRPTLSLHLASVHAKSPLQPAVADLHRRLEQAKNLGGRDCFSILADVRSGAPAWMVAGWDQWLTFLASLELFTNWSHEDFVNGARWPAKDVLKDRNQRTLPSKLPHAMLAALERFYQNDGTCIGSRALMGELGRLLGRRVSNSSAAGDPLLKFLEPRTGGVPEAGSNKEPPETGRIGGLEALTSALQVIAFLARELRWESDDE
jgi:hypothetical protein